MAIIYITALIYYIIFSIHMGILCMGLQQQTASPHVIAIKEGADLDLSCPIVVPNEDMIISWTCDDEPANVRSSRIHITETGKLRIKSAKVGDACNYRCEAANGFGTLSMVIKVIVVDKQLRLRLGKLNQTDDKLLGPHNNPIKENHEHLTNASVGRDDQSLGQQSSSSVRASKMNANQVSDELAQKQLLPSHRIKELEVQVQPPVVLIERNKSFSLECRVRHPPELMAPHIIWLKEFIGPKPSSMAEAHEQNLVIIDDVYYHSLNWPRSVSYSESGARLNSALLIRQSNPVHSGRYICFAGYPPAIMHSSTRLNFSHTEPPKEKFEAGSAPSTSTKTKSLKYKMAIAFVKVGSLKAQNLGHLQSLMLANNRVQSLKTNNNGSNHNKMEIDSAYDDFQRQQQQLQLLLLNQNFNDWSAESEHDSENLLISIFATNSWLGIIAIALTLCGLFLVIKLIYASHRSYNRCSTTGTATTNNRGADLALPRASLNSANGVDGGRNNNDLSDTSTSLNKRCKCQLRDLNGGSPSSLTPSDTTDGITNCRIIDNMASENDVQNIQRQSSDPVLGSQPVNRSSTLLYLNRENGSEVKKFNSSESRGPSLDTKGLSGQSESYAKNYADIYIDEDSNNSHLYSEIDIFSALALKDRQLP